MIRLKDCLLAACLLSPLTQAADLGTGDLWPVREQDMLQLITAASAVAAILWPVGPDDGCV